MSTIDSAELRGRAAQVPPARLTQWARSAARQQPPHRWWLLAILGINALLELCDLTKMGLQNTFYAAAAWSGATNWRAFFFAGLDPAGGATVDKPPLAFWVQAVSVRWWGLNSWGLLLPQVVMGVACSALLYLTVRRLGGATAGLLAAAAMTLTPVGVWMFKSDNPDPLMVLLLVASAYFLVRALEGGGAGWMTACGVAVGLAFEAKMLEAVLIVPGLALAFLVCGGGGIRRRLAGLLAAGAAMVVAGGWWMVLVQLTPPDRRPYISGTDDNSVFSLAFGYNGAERLAASSVSLHTTDRLFVGGMGSLISFLLPAAVLAVPLLLLGSHGGRRDPRRAAGILFGGWLLVAGLTLTYSAGLVNVYYVLVIAPPIAALIGVAGSYLWQRHERPTSVVLLMVAAAGTAIWGAVVLHGHHPTAAWLTLLIGAGALALLTILLNRQRVSAPEPGLLAGLTGGVLIAALLLPTGVEAVHQVGTVHEPAMMYTAEPGLLQLLEADRPGTGFTAAVLGGRPAAELELQTGRPVLDIGGYHGDEALPTLPTLEGMVLDHRIRYFVRGITEPSRPAAGEEPARSAATGRTPARQAGSSPAAGHSIHPPWWAGVEFTSWISTHYRVVYRDRTTDLYDLSQTMQTRTSHSQTISTSHVRSAAAR